jgi:hypothetical protein
MNLTDEGLKEYYEKYANEQQKYQLEYIMALVFANSLWFTLSRDMSKNLMLKVRDFYHCLFFKSYWSSKK